MITTISYSKGIFDAYDYLLKNHKDFFVIGQGLWSPWYVGSTMKDLDKKYGKERVIDCPVSELATTGASVGAAINGMRPMIVHPRIDFMLLAVDQIVTQAAKWRHMFGGNSSCPVTFRGIINRGGEQGAQHSQSLHSWFAHIPGLRVVMPSSPNDVRDLMISSVLCDDPVLFIDDRWLYEVEEKRKPIDFTPLNEIKPKVISKGTDITLVGIGHTTNLLKNTQNELLSQNVSCEIIDLRVLNPIDSKIIIDSVEKTKRLLVVDGDWSSCGLSSEIISIVAESINPKKLLNCPARITFPDAPAPTSKVLESEFYISKSQIIDKVLSLVK